jgi:hypothetical protein
MKRRLLLIAFLLCTCYANEAPSAAADNAPIPASLDAEHTDNKTEHTGPLKTTQRSNAESLATRPNLDSFSKRQIESHAGEKHVEQHKGIRTPPPAGPSENKWFGIVVVALVVCVASITAALLQKCFELLHVTKESILQRIRGSSSVHRFLRAVVAAIAVVGRANATVVFLGFGLCGKLLRRRASPATAASHDSFPEPARQAWDVEWSSTSDAESAPPVTKNSNKKTGNKQQ